MGSKTFILVVSPSEILRSFEKSKFWEIQTYFSLTRWFQIKKSSTTKFHNILRSTTFILVVSLSEVTYKIWISNLRNLNVVFHDKMILNEKVINYKVSYFSRSTTFIFTVCPSEIVQKIKISIFWKFKHSFPWQYDFKSKSCQL